MFSISKWFGGTTKAVAPRAPLTCEVLDNRIVPAFMDFAFTLQNGDSGSGWVDYDNQSIDVTDPQAAADIYDFELTLDGVSFGLNDCEKLQMTFAYGQFDSLLVSISSYNQQIIWPDNYKYEAIQINGGDITATPTGQDYGIEGTVQYCYRGDDGLDYSVFGSGGSGGL